MDESRQQPLANDRTAEVHEEGSTRGLALVALRFSPVVIFAASCSSTTTECYYDGRVVDCSPSYCDVTCEDNTGRHQCTDLANDPYNCGACGATCFEGVCSEGRCEAAGYDCQDYGLTTCYDAAGHEYCADTVSDELNCGGCMLECTSGVCVDSFCQ